MARLEIDINKLSPEERLDLIEELWGSLSVDPGKIPVTDAQAKELDRRVAEMDQDDSLGIPWDTVLAQIRHACHHGPVRRAAAAVVADFRDVRVPFCSKKSLRFHTERHVAAPPC